MVEELDGYMSATAAAAHLGVTARRVHALIADGSLPSVRAGDRRLVRRDDVEARARQGASPGGRPFSPRRAWALILLASGDAVAELDPVTRSKLRKVLAERDLWSIRSKLRGRAKRLELRAHSSDLSRIEEAPDVVRTGGRAALDAGLGLSAPDARVEVYVDERAANRLIERFALRPSRDSNVVLHLVPDEVRAWIRGPVAPRLAVALDLALAGDARSEAVAREILDGR